MSDPYYPTDLRGSGGSHDSLANSGQGFGGMLGNPNYMYPNILPYFPIHPANAPLMSMNNSNQYYFEGRASPSSHNTNAHSNQGGSGEPVAKRPKLTDDGNGTKRQSQKNTPATAATGTTGIVPKCQYKFRPGEALEYLHLEPTFYGHAWYSVLVSSRGQKTIGNTTVPFYVLCWPDKDQSISVEEWRLRFPLTSPVLSDVTTTVPSGTCVECLSILEAQNGKDLRTWFMGQLTSDCKPGAKPQVSYRNTLWNKNNAPVSLERGSVRIVQSDAVTDLIWKDRTPTTFLSDEEHLLAGFIREASQLCSELDKKANTLTVEEFEDDRDRLCNIIDSLTNARHYDKSIQFLTFMQDFELRISRNS